MISISQYFTIILMLETIISKNFRLISKIGINPFYEVFKGIHLKNETTVAIKIQKRSVSESRLYNQAKIIKQIQGDSQVTDFGIPQIVQIGTEDSFNYMMMNLLGPSLDSYMMERGGKIQIELSLNFGKQMIQRIQLIHQKGFIHRDLRPEHFLYGREKRPDKIYITGLSISKKYLRVDKKHYPYKDNKLSYSGTARYASVNTLLGIEQSRRDDLQSIIYIVIYMIKGYLPWQGVKASDKKQKIERILMAKITTPFQDLCKNLPQQIKSILQLVREAEYEDQPDYLCIIKKLGNALMALKDIRA